MLYLNPDSVIVVENCTGILKSICYEQWSEQSTTHGAHVSNMESKFKVITWVSSESMKAAVQSPDCACRREILEGHFSEQFHLKVSKNR